MSKALVLAGGGVTGIAWETGILLGLRDAGIDALANLDLVVGTSAGSTVGAQVLSGTDLADLYELQLSDAHNEISPKLDLELLATMFSLMSDGATHSDELRAQIGAMSLNAPTVDEATRRRVIEHRLISHEWPQTRLLLTAIDAVTGEFVTWDQSSGISIIDAVASSCAVPVVWPCATINGRRYFDGGLRNSANAYLAAGHDDILVLAPLTGGPSPAVQKELDELESNGSVVRMITTDAEAIAAMGPNSLDPRFRRVAAEHGRRQGAMAASIF